MRSDDAKTVYWIAGAFIVGVLLGFFFPAGSADTERLDRIGERIVELDAAIEAESERIARGIDDATGTASDIDATISRLEASIDAAIRITEQTERAIRDIQALVGGDDLPPSGYD